MKAIAKAHTNIALIKYWGKRDETLILPTNSSLSITLDQFYTETAVEYSRGLKKDVFYLNGKLANEKETQKVSRFLDLVRKQAGNDLKAEIHSDNHVPTAAGFASSASGIAALAAAATKAMGLELDSQSLSRLARRGSGSACRSIYGGFVKWEKGHSADGEDSYAIPILPEDQWDLSVLSVMLERKQKKVLSREGMKRTVDTSVFYNGWLETVPNDLVRMEEAIKNRDFQQLGSVAEKNALKMHATTLGADPPFLYWSSSTLSVMEKVQELREQGIQAYFTIDAGPNVKVLCEKENEKRVADELSKLPDVKELFICHPGPGISYLDV